jgi:hypothetical protein
VPTRKQRRRRNKSRRHDYEYVWVDEEGNEVDVDPAEARQEKAGGKNGKPRPARDSKGRPVRKIEPPSWSRVGKRAAIFAPVMFIVVWILRPKGASPASVVVQTCVLLGFFLPFSYLMDSLMYRTYLRRTGQSGKS